VGDSDLISEKILAEEYSSLWRNIIPLSDGFTRRVNTEQTRFAVRTSRSNNPFESSLESELGFRLFVEAAHGRMSLDRPDPAALKALERDVRGYVQDLPRPHSMSWLIGSDITALEIARRMAFYFSTNDPFPIVVHPTFRGCGIVDACQGDLLVGSTLYEIKNVSRPYRAVDIRQVLIYCALAKAAGEPLIEHIALLNAREGTVFKIGINDLAQGLGSAAAADLLDLVIYQISDVDVSG
jgi:hypothetical protein